MDNFHLSLPSLLWGKMDDGHYLKTELRTRYDTIQIFIKPKREKSPIIWLSQVVLVLSQISAEWVKVENACQCSLKATAFCVLAVAAAASFGRKQRKPKQRAEKFYLDKPRLSR